MPLCNKVFKRYDRFYTAAVQALRDRIFSGNLLTAVLRPRRTYRTPEGRSFRSDEAHCKEGETVAGDEVFGVFAAFFVLIFNLLKIEEIETF